MTKHGFGKLASLAEASRIIEDVAGKTGRETVSLEDADGRVLAEDIKSSIDVPHFQKSAMDGFAVIAEDTFGASNTSPKHLKVIESVTAGVIPRKEVRKGECIELTTGAPLPKGADAVLMIEYAEKEDGSIVFYKACAPGENTISAGSDVRSGQLIFSKGTRLNPRYLGVLSSVGIRCVKVSKAPSVAYFSTGNEVLSPGQALLPGKVYDINTRTVVDTLKEHGCNVHCLGLVSDNVSDIKKAILSGIDDVDLLIFSGGSSLGGEDFMLDAVGQIGDVLVHGIASKPGKPVLVGKVRSSPVIGLPGYPTSALSNVYSLVLPAIYRMMGSEFRLKKAYAVLERKVASTIGRFEFLPVRLKVSEAKKNGLDTSSPFFTASPVMKGSSAITTLSDADGFICIDENTEVVRKGDVVEVSLF
ncbi:molybdopterin molybdenumtransferase MoeA [Candidatus Woesearchaeota archaeon]|nr:molybdopterin molybdenumtransferase MoeA [Candidatus Woesearchaeota archaeon]